jgi:hypothetical protein
MYVLGLPKIKLLELLAISTALSQRAKKFGYIFWGILLSKFWPAQA